MTRFFSSKARAPHLGPFPVETLRRVPGPVDLSAIAPTRPMSFARDDAPFDIVNAMRDHQAMLDAIRSGPVNPQRAGTPQDAEERARHLKSFAYFADAAVAGACRLPPEARLERPFANPDMGRLSRMLASGEVKTLASGIDTIMADLRESIAAPLPGIEDHDHVLVLMYEAPRAPGTGEAGCGWIAGAERHRAALLASETAVVLANYLRLLGHSARAHTVTSSDLCLDRLAVAAGLATPEGGALVNPFLEDRFALAAVSTGFEIAPDAPLAPRARQPRRPGAGGDAPRRGLGDAPFARRRFAEGAHPFERLKRVERPTTYIDEPRVARVPKRTDMFARAQFGDMGKRLQDATVGGHYVRKAAPSMAQRRALGAFTLLQDGAPAPERQEIAPEEAAALVKATCYFLGIDAVGISRCPDWTWYSHDARGQEIVPPHDQAISMVIDQGYETMEGSSGDDWIAVAQSMRAYLRFSLLGGVVARQIRNLGYSAKAHTVMDGEVLQPPLLLLSGLGEVSRIGEVILNPFLGPRLKSGVVTTDLPMAHDLPIDFGLQRFCESCNKCARECPSGAITAGPKLMFNGYEIWKSDSQKCTTYRVTTEGGAMCGRCMKTCPWNLEGIFKERPFRWAAMTFPTLAPALARLDDAVGNGGLNPVKKWWWDLEIDAAGGYQPTDKPVNRRDLQRDLKLDYAEQTLAVYPAPLAPHPWPYPYAMDREAGIEAYQALVTAEEYRDRLARGDDSMVHRYAASGESPVLQLEVARVEEMAEGIAAYELRDPDGGDLPEWRAGAHLDIVVAPEYLRQYSICSDPGARDHYRIGVLREEGGRGGSRLLQRIFTPGRRVFVSRPINHFPLEAQAREVLLIGGGIGITPLIAMAHELHREGRAFALHYAGRSRGKMGFLDELARAPWEGHVHMHISDEGSRADLDTLVAGYAPGRHLYTCGSAPFMEAVMQAAERAGWPEEARHLEYFAVPEQPEYVNHPFTLRLTRSGRDIAVPANLSAADALRAAGVAVDIKCSDGICGVCRCGLSGGEVEHRDFVLSRAQREDAIILCQSRAAESGGVVEIDL